MAVLRAPILHNESTAKLIPGCASFDTESNDLLMYKQSQGDRRCWTWSGWVRMDGRPSDSAGEPAFFGSQADSNNRTGLYWRTDRKLQFFWKSGGWGAVNTNMAFTDPTQWYHIVCAFKSTWGTAESDRVIWYVNGERQPVWTEGSGFPAQNYESMFNVYNQWCYFGIWDGTNEPNNEFADVYYLDGFKGQASDFGFKDPLTGTWRPKKFRGVNIETWVGGMGAYADLTHDNSMMGKSLTNNNGVTFEAAGANGFGIETAATFVRDSDQTFTIVGAFGAYEPATIDFFCKFDNLDDEQYAISLSGTSFGVRDDSGTYKWCLHSQDASGTYQGMVYLGAADTNWHHIRIVTYPCTNGVWIDGEQQNLGGVYPRGLNVTGTTQTIGGQEDGSNEMDGKIAGFRVGNQVLWGPPPTGGFQFHEIQGGYNKNSQAGKFSHQKDVGYNGWYLPLDGTGYSAFQTAGNMGQNQSGRGKIYTIQEGEWRTQDWTVSTAPEYRTSSPSGSSHQVDTTAGITTTGFPANYVTLNPLSNNRGSAWNLYDGKLKYNNNGSNGWGLIKGTRGATTGRYYFEGTATDASHCAMGICQSHQVTTNDATFGNSSQAGYRSWGYLSTGSVNNDATGWDGYGAWSDGDVVGCAVDIDNGNIWWHRNGTWIINSGGTNPATGSAGNPETGANPWDTDVKVAATGGGADAFLMPAVAVQNGTFVANFGQKPFAYAPPTGYLPWCSANLDANNITNVDTYVGVTTYIGDGSSPRNIGGLNFQPDLIIYKERSEDRDWQVYDSVRGVGPAKNLVLNTTYAQASNDDTSYGYTSAFNPNGFTVTDGSSGGNENIYTNKSGQTYVAWGWKAGGNTGTFNIDGTGHSTAAAAGLDGGTINPTGASVGTKQGFSVIQYTGNNSSVTISHGLKKAPRFIVQKFASGDGNWNIYHHILGNTQRLTFTQDAEGTGYWNSTDPTDSVFSIGSGINDNGVTMVAYLWHDVPGLQKFGFYNGNESADGDWTDLGFRPAILWVKNVDDGSTHWVAIDKLRDPYNPCGTKMALNSYLADYMGGSFRDECEFMGTGFRVIGTSTDSSGMNKNTKKYIYAAWADQSASGLYGSISNCRPNG